MRRGAVGNLAVCLAGSAQGLDVVEGRSGAASNRTPCTAADTATTRSTGSGGCCAGPRRCCPNGPGPACKLDSCSATRAAS